MIDILSAGIINVECRVVSSSTFTIMIFKIDTQLPVSSCEVVDGIQAENIFRYFLCYNALIISTYLLHLTIKLHILYVAVAINCLNCWQIIKLINN